MKSENYEGFTIVFNKIANGVSAGFPKNPNMTHGRNKAEAFEQMKAIIGGFSPIVRQTYKEHGAIMRKLEER